MEHEDEFDLMVEGESDSSFSEDDLEEVVNILEVRERNQNYLEETVPQYTDNVFLEHFRVSREVVNSLTERFEQSRYYSQHFGQFGKISAKYQVLIFLWYIGHQTSSFRDVADRFDITISSLFRIIRRLIYFLSNMSPHIIKWPSEQEKADIETHFRQQGFPGVIGAIDGTHIKIDRPDDDPDSYINRKGYFSIQLQVVCDCEKKIRDVFVGFPGSVHDSRVFRRSPLSNTLREKCGNYYILGDSGYPLQPNLLTPFKNMGNLTRQQRLFNTKLSTNRYVVEHCFGHLKQKFRQLYHLKLRNMRDMVHLIRASCVLHNLSLDDNFIEEVAQEEQDMVNAHLNDEEDVVDEDGVVVRNRVMNELR